MASGNYSIGYNGISYKRDAITRLFSVATKGKLKGYAGQTNGKLQLTMTDASEVVGKGKWFAYDVTGKLKGNTLGYSSRQDAAELALCETASEPTKGTHKHTQVLGADSKALASAKVANAVKSEVAQEATK